MSMLSRSVDPSRSPRACLCSSSSSTMRTTSSSSSSSGRHMNMNLRRGKSRNMRKQYIGVSAAVSSSSKCLLNSFLHTKSSNNGSLRQQREQQQQQQQQHYGLHRRQETKLYAASSTDRGLDGTASTPPPSASVSASASAAASPATEPQPPAAKPKKKGDSLEAMRKFSEQYAKRSNTYFCVDKGVTAVVIKGLAEHKDELGAPLCPCRHYDDKAAEVADGFWNCPCVPMRERHECHCMLFLTPDNDFAGEEQHITRDEIDEGTGGR